FLSSVRATRIILRLIPIESFQPLFRGLAVRNVRRMNVKSLRAVREHARGRPLPRPKFNFSKNALPFARQFAKTSAMPLWMDFSRKNFNTGNPSFFQVCFTAAACQLAGIDPTGR